MDKINEQLYQANIDLVDKNTVLEEDVRILKKRINNAIEYIKRTEDKYNEEIDKEIIAILKGEVIVNE